MWTEFTTHQISVITTTAIDTALNMASLIDFNFMFLRLLKRMWAQTCL